MAKNTAKDASMAAYLKMHKVVRTTGKCAQCYRTITVESNTSRYSHNCHG